MLQQSAATQSPPVGFHPASFRPHARPASSAAEDHPAEAGERTLLRRAGNAVARLRSNYDDMERRLSDAKMEVAELKDQVAGWRSRHHSIRRLDVSSLRRQVAFQCHPDRGGDSNLMTRLNALLDVLESMQAPCQASGY